MIFRNFVQVKQYEEEKKGIDTTDNTFKWKWSCVGTSLKSDFNIEDETVLNEIGNYKMLCNVKQN